MGAHMKTTIEIADELLERAKRQARREHKTLRAVIEEALRRQLSSSGTPEPFRLKRHTFKGKGMQPGITEGDWETVRDLIYRLK
jgi:predicted transcriptional regulator